MVDIWETVEQHFLFLSVDKYRFSNMGNHYKRRKDKQKKKKPDLNNGKSQNHLRESPYNVNRS